MRILLLSSACMSFICPNLEDNSSVITPTNSLGQSIVIFSYGSYGAPSIILIIASGLETWNSRPSLRMSSINTERCNSPLPDTLNSSALSVLSTLMLTLVCNSFCKRAQRSLEVAYLPSFPENGEVLTPKVIITVGSSIEIRPRDSGFSLEVMVSPIEMLVAPDTATISPALASSTSYLDRSLKENKWSALNGICEPSSPIKTRGSFLLMLPLNIRPMAICPIWLS